MRKFLLICSAVVFACAWAEGWENVVPARQEFPVAKALWTSCAETDITWELRAGAAGAVSTTGGVIRVEHTNACGYILVKAKPFHVKAGTMLRFHADVEVPVADTDYSVGFLRAYGHAEDLAPDDKSENQNFFFGGQHVMRALPNSPPGETYRKFYQYRAVEDFVTPVIVVAGMPSVTVWKTWGAEDVDAAQALWKRHFDAHQAHDHAADRMDEATFDRLLSFDPTNHVAEIRRIDGVSRLVVDGEIAAPVVYKSKNVPTTEIETFAGKKLDGSDVRLMVKSIRLGGTPQQPGYWTPQGFDVKGAVRELKDAMRLAPKSLFLVSLGCAAYPEFTEKEHPEESWCTADGKRVYGTAGSCVSTYSSSGVFDPKARKWPWPSYSSKVYRAGVKACIRSFVGELKAQGLSKRIVGIHTFGYHDGQFTAPYTDYSEPAKAAYREYVRSPNCLSTNYAFVAKQAGFRAQEEFAREFKQALGKPAIAVRWCESPLSPKMTGALDITSFVNSDVIDVIVTQPNYMQRRPAMPTVCPLPLASFHLHGKMLWNEFDLRTWGAFESWASSPVSLVGLGHSEDFTMWQTVYRKLAGMMDGARMGNWFYDMGGGWFEPDEIAADIKTLVREQRDLARLKPSPWRPDVAIVIDEAGLIQSERPFDCPHLQSELLRCGCYGAGVPFEHYLAEDVMNDPTLLDRAKLVFLNGFRRIDDRRKRFLTQLAQPGRTLVFAADDGVFGGAEATGFRLKVEEGLFSHRTEPIPSFIDAIMMRQFRKTEKPLDFQIGGPRISIVEESGVTALSRYSSDNAIAVASRETAGVRRVYVGEFAGLDSAAVLQLAKEAGAYAPLDRPGLLVDMNGDFISVHALKNGRYVFKLPFACRVKNMKTGRFETVSADEFALTVTAGETRRYRLLPILPYLDEDPWPDVALETWRDIGLSGPSDKPVKVVSAKCRGLSCLPRRATAGETVRLSADFEGAIPTFPVKLHLSLLHGGSPRWDETVTVGEDALVRSADNVWRLEFAYRLPTYIGSGKVQVRVESPAIRHPAGALPETELTISALEAVPGWERPHTGGVTVVAGSPQLAVDGKATYALWGASPSKRRVDRRNRHSDAPLTFVSVWTEGTAWWPRGEEFNPANFDLKAEAHARENPEAYFIWDLSLYPPVDWRSENPDEIAADELGRMSVDGGDRQVNWSFGSKKAIEAMERMLVKAIDYLEHAPYRHRIVGYRVNSGHTIEWLGWFPPANTTLDFSPAGKRAFAEYAAQNYPQLVDRAVPTLAERRLLDDGEYVWDERRHLKAVAYHHFISDVNAANVIRLCRTARERTQGKKLVGTYYGYMGQFQGGAGQMKAHFSLAKVLTSKAVDFLMSPQEYPGRDPGMTCMDMKPFSALSAAGVVSVIEDDTRTHNMPSLDRIIGQTYNERMTTGILRRNMGISICRNLPFYTLALTTGTEFDYPQFAADATILRRVGEEALRRGVARKSEIAYVVSEENIKSSPMIDAKNYGVDSWEESWQRYRHGGKVERGSRRAGNLYGEVHRHALNRLSRIGAPVDLLLLESLFDDPGEYKLYVFSACCRTSPEFVKLADRLRQRNCTILWTAAPGYGDASGKSLANVCRLTGMDLGKIDGKMAPGVVLGDGTHSGFTKNPVAPLFFVRRADEVIGTYTNGLAGLAAVQTGKARSVYSGSARIELEVYRAIARRAGVFLYSDTCDPMEANESFVTLHARTAGRKTINLPRRTSVADVFGRRVVARNAESFSFESPLHASWLFYCGDDAEDFLERLNE